MTEEQKNSRGTRPRKKRIEVWLTPEEHAEIAGRATASGLSHSSYLRLTGLNHSIRSIADLDAVTDLVKVTGDLGRVAGLLKLWLAEKRGQGARPIDVDTMMKEFRGLQEQIRAVTGKLIR